MLCFENSFSHTSVIIINPHHLQQTQTQHPFYCRSHVFLWQNFPTNLDLVFLFIILKLALKIYNKTSTMVLTGEGGSIASARQLSWEGWWTCSAGAAGEGQEQGGERGVGHLGGQGVGHHLQLSQEHQSSELFFGSSDSALLSQNDSNHGCARGEPPIQVLSITLLIWAVTRTVVGSPYGPL